MKLIVGLGNPGSEYAQTRHNVGFMVVDGISQNWKHDKKLEADTSEVSINNQKVLLAKPQTYMNNSGEAVQKIAHYYKIESTDIIVIYDDVDLEFGKLRVRHNGGSGGHNGLKSIIEHIGDEFVRFRVGVRNETLKDPIPTDKFVLAPFSVSEQRLIADVISRAKNELESYLASPEEYSKHLLTH